jgi:predicted DNA-binding mobile mystery protein A
MSRAAEQIDRKLKALRPLAQTVRPARGWVRAIRDALGMTTKQLGKRMGVSQPRIVMLEKAEATGNITLESLERAAEAMGCRVVYAFVPRVRLTAMLQEQAHKTAERHLESVEQTMRLEGQGVSNPKLRAGMRKKLVEDLMQRPARLWNEA